MFISVKRHEREKQELIDASNRLTDAILKSSAQGLFLLDAKDKIQPQVSALAGHAVSAPGFRQSQLRETDRAAGHGQDPERGAHLHRRACSTRRDAPSGPDASPIRCRTSKSAWPMPTAASTPRTTRSSSAPSSSREPRAWLVRVTDITAARADSSASSRICARRCRPRARSCAASCKSGGARFAALAAANRRLDEDHQRGAEEAGARGTTRFATSSRRRSRRSIGCGAMPPRSSSPALEAAARLVRGLAARIAQPRLVERQRFPAAGGQARPALWAVRAAALA